MADKLVSPHPVQDFRLLPERLLVRTPFAQWELITGVEFTATQDTEIVHGLQPPTPEHIDYVIVRQTGPASIYHDASPTRRVWGKNYIILRSDQTVTADVLLSVSQTSAAERTVLDAPFTFTPNKHNLLDANTHFDTVTQTVSRGSLIVGKTSTPVWDELVLGAADTFLKSDGTDANWQPIRRQITLVIDGGGATITTGVKGFLSVPFACTIKKWRLLSTDAAVTSGSITIDIWKDTYANYAPTVADTITASAKPSLSSAIKNEDTTLSGWTTTIAAGEILGFNVDSATSVTKVTLHIEVE